MRSCSAGGISADAPTTITNSTITGNTAGTRGGGVYFFSGGGLYVVNSTIDRNRAGDTNGGGSDSDLAFATPGHPAPSAVTDVASLTFDVTAIVTRRPASCQEPCVGLGRAEAGGVTPRRPSAA